MRLMTVGAAFRQPESRSVIELDLAGAVAMGGGRAGPEVLLTSDTAGEGAVPAAFSKSSTCRDAGRLLLPLLRPLSCCARDLHDHTK